MGGFMLANIDFADARNSLRIGEAYRRYTNLPSPTIKLNLDRDYE
jgi:hypothetical protein